ncbi:hypothetical protein [Glutamicibacter sp. FBE19]|uniref:hypothetical protein n=1 Tax=Glutamicibacter sp. FBE19 TaxID=2761534 RepID=UPI0018966DB4|nr:hypothetical protein [Glutamicibacter sp. FBE19]MBF6671564.1 hypothetical protein [Glutamicibacter sp. FBE19]
MSDPVVRYETAPKLSINYPDCSACSTEVEHDGDSWYCARCGTTWDIDAGDGDEGMLYEDWNGEPNPGELRTHDNGYELTQYERDNPKPSIWGDFGTQLGKIIAGGTQ